jgi:hypothetical protein
VKSAFLFAIVLFLLSAPARAEDNRTRIQQLLDKRSNAAPVESANRAAVPMRTPSCDEILSLVSNWPPNALDRLFGKRTADMTVEDFNQAIGSVSHCRDSVVATPETPSAPPSQRRHIRLKVLAMIGGQLEPAHAAAVAERKAQQRADEKRQQEELAWQQVAEECRQQCGQKLATMLQELQSLGTDEASEKRLAKLKTEREELVRKMPRDVRESLVALDDKFNVEFGSRQLAVNKAGKERRRKKEITGQLETLYLLYLTLQVCAEKFPQFENARSNLRNGLKEMEKSVTPEETNPIWNRTAEQFRAMESMLRMSGDERLYTECDQSSRYVAGLLLISPGLGGASQAPLKRKDF